MHIILIAILAALGLAAVAKAPSAIAFAVAALAAGVIHRRLGGGIDQLLAGSGASFSRLRDGDGWHRDAGAQRALDAMLRDAVALTGLIAIHPGAAARAIRG